MHRELPWVSSERDPDGFADTCHAHSVTKRTGIGRRGRQGSDVHTSTVEEFLVSLPTRPPALTESEVKRGGVCAGVGLGVLWALQHGQPLWEHALRFGVLLFVVVPGCGRSDGRRGDPRAADGLGVNGQQRLGKGRRTDAPSRRPPHALPTRPPTRPQPRPVNPTSNGRDHTPC
jgi:hypothetical protein